MLKKSKFFYVRSFCLRKPLFKICTIETKCPRITSIHIVDHNNSTNKNERFNMFRRDVKGQLNLYNWGLEWNICLKQTRTRDANCM